MLDLDYVDWGSAQAKIMSRLVFRAFGRASSKASRVLSPSGT